MASFQKRGKAWRVELYRNGARETATFPTKAQAASWALQRDAELTGARLPDKSLDAALERYGREKRPPTDAGQRWQDTKIRNLRTYPLAKVPLAKLTRQHFAQWRDERMAGPRLRGKGPVGPATVNRELNLIRAVISECIEWGWLRDNPMAGLKRPQDPRARRRRITAVEVDALLKGLGHTGGPPETVSQRVALAFLFALETAMRGGEIVRLQWAHVGELSVHLPKTKNGDARDVPLSKAAREILTRLPHGSGPVFGITDAQRDALFRAGRQRAELSDLHFHDSRAEAIWRLSKRLDVLELARVIGHRNLSSLLQYYDASAAELAAKLG